MKMIKHYLALIRFDKPIGSLLLLWPTLTALFLASDGKPSAANLVIFTLGVFIMRSAGCIVNDALDRNFDKHVIRTKERPLAKNQVSIYGACILCFVLLFFAFMLVLQTNMMTIALAFVAVVLTALYPTMKRITHLPQVWLGLCFNWGIIMAYSASHHALDVNCWLFYIANVILTVAYDTFYAMVDRDDDIKLGLKSTAILFGTCDKLYTAGLQLLYFVMICLIGENLNLNHWFDLGLLLAMMTIIYQQFLIRDRDREGCFKAFLNSHLTLLAIFIGVFLSFQA